MKRDEETLGPEVFRLLDRLESDPGPDETRRLLANIFNQAQISIEPDPLEAFAKSVEEVGNAPSWIWAGRVEWPILFALHVITAGRSRFSLLESEQDLLGELPPLSVVLREKMLRLHSVDIQYSEKGEFSGHCDALVLNPYPGRISPARGARPGADGVPGF